MKSFIANIILAAAFLGSFQCEAAAKKPQNTEKATDPRSKITIGVKTNKSALSYKEGEEMIFTFKTDFAGVKPGDWYLSYTRKGDDGKTFSGKIKASEPLKVKTSIDRPGFVSVNVYLTDAKGNRVHYLNKRNRKVSIGVFAGTAVKAQTLKDCGEPEDFDAFWTAQKKRLAAVPFKGKVEVKPVKKFKNGSVYAVTIPAPGPRPATGYMMIPKNAKAKSLPISLTFFGYGNVTQKVPARFSGGSIRFLLNAHGQKLGQDAAYYKKFFKSIGSGRYNYAFDPEQNKDRENCFFNGMVMRILRTLEYLKTRPEWNGRDISVGGGSQGGLQAAWAAALDQDVTSAVSSITWCCDIAGSTKAKRLDGNWRIKYVPALDYYDPVFMAKRIKKAKVDIPRSGLGDYVSPPSGIAIFYNNLATPHKTIRFVQGSSHGFIPKNTETVVWSTLKK